jgi:hypothetical protein
LFIFPGCLLAFSFMGCKNQLDGTTTVKGTVVEEGSTRRIPNAEVLLIKQKRESATAMGRQTVMHVNADEKGDFSFSFEADGDYYYTAEAKAEYYFDGGEGGSIKSGVPNKNVEIRLKPKGYIRLLLVNEPPKDTLQSFSTAYVPGGLRINNLFSDTTIYMFGLQGKDVFTYWLQRNGQEVQNQINIELFPLDTTEVAVKY